MDLTELVHGLGVTPLSASATGDARAGVVSEIDVRGICYDSRGVVPGDLFVAWSGEKTDGRRFAQQALGLGAVAVLAGGPPLEEPPAVSVPWLVAEDPRSLLGPMAARLYGQPQEALVSVGITGTNGKTTTTLVVGEMFDVAGIPAGTIGTLGYFFGDLDLGGERTTPEGNDLFRCLAEMRDAGAGAVVMEVSSHALAQKRVEGMAFDVAAFTNLTRDHFDFHPDFDHYFASKRRLFDKLRPGGRSVVNIDDAWGRKLAAELDEPITVGKGGQVKVVDADLDEQGIRARISTPRGDLSIESPLLGSYNLENLCGAIAIGEARELPHEAMAAAIARRGPVNGRLERVEAGQEFPVLIDFAHTDGGLEAALRSVRRLTARKIAVVFGCGGDRDPGKRPLMGRVAGELADLPIVTSDNPRSEDPQAIIAAVEEGLRESGNRKYKVIPDRREAIRRAVGVASRRGDWCVVVAGKGHEEMQIIGDQVLPFSDRAELVAALEEVLGTTAHG